MSETNLLEDCLKISQFRVILTVKRPQSHGLSFIQVGVTLWQDGGVVDACLEAECAI